MSHASLGDQRGELEARIRDIEQENSNLASLYVALSQLHSTLEVGEVVGAIIEVLLNFVGAEVFAVQVVDGTGLVRCIAAHGVEVSSVPPVRPGEGVIGKVLSEGEPFLGEVRSLPPSDLRQPPVVCLPLHAVGEQIGALPIWSFLQQKDDFADIDHEIFQLLSRSAGIALEAARVSMTAGQKPDQGYYEAFAALLDQSES